MIKWFDADKFLPGKNAGRVMIRMMPDLIPVYAVGTYEDMIWWADEIEPIDYTVTHWAFINEPFE